MPRPRLLLFLILLAYLLIGGLYATLTPPWQIPDEPAHYNYIRHIVEQRTLPILQLGDYDADYLERLKAERFPPHLPIDSVRYEAWQPPLYYLLAAPIFAATNGSLVAIRLFTLVLGSLVIVLTYTLGRALFPASASLALTAAGFIAFIPQHIAMMAAANNDALAEVLIAFSLLLALRTAIPPSPLSPPPTRPHAHMPTRLWIFSGVVLGLAFLTKLSAYSLAALFAVALLLAARRQGWTPRQLARAAAQVFLPAILLGGLWWTRNLFVYGGLDFLAFARHDLVVQGQPRTGEALALWGAQTYLINFVQTTFQSWWGQFGWMGVVMDWRVYLGLLVYTLALAVGAAGALLSGRAPAGGRPPRLPRDAAVLLVVQVLLTITVYLYYNLTFVQFQGRYLFPALPIVALAAAVALHQWSRWLAAALRLPEGIAGGWLLYAPPVAAVALMAALDVFALYRFIVPALASG